MTLLACVGFAVSVFCPLQATGEVRFTLHGGEAFGGHERVRLPLPGLGVSVWPAVVA
jgi:hypothetical protein